MKEIKPRAKTGEEILTARVLELFLEKIDILSNKQRDKIIRLLEFLILPRYLAEGKPPIEEEYLESHNLKKMDKDDIILK